MGLKSSTQRTFLSINPNGKLAQRMQGPGPGVKDRTKDDGGIIFEMEHASVSGFIKGFSYKTTNFKGKDVEFFQIVIDDGEDVFQLDMQVQSRYFNSFCNSLPNINLDEEVELTPWRRENADKTLSMALYVKQGGENVEWAYTKDNPGLLPQPKKFVINGKDVYDWEPVTTFHKANITAALSILKGLAPKAEPEKADKPAPAGYTPPDPADDLPF